MTTLVTLTNTNSMEVRFLSRGGIILSVLAPDRDGALADVVLGFSDIRQYLNDRFYFGAIVGRSANRIADGLLKIGASAFELSKNDGAHHLHGGTRGFSACEWSVTPIETGFAVGALLSMESPHGDQGYPGTLAVQVRYLLTNSNELRLEYRATTDAPTPVNLTQHTYFNLTGCSACNILDHMLTLNASQYTPVDQSLIPTGELRAVAGTPFDFRSPRPIGERIADDDDQLQHGGGYDHNFVLGVPLPGDRLTFAARLFDPSTGRALTVRTTKPGLQIYTGNDLAEVRQGKNGAYGRYSGVALETQHFPDTPNHSNFPSTILHPGQEYFSETSYQFSVVPEGPGE
ncbi:MAG: galactose mutarotase [Phycisphaerae bacterium]|nr:galactose mutarotase [Gemmatimonadaceae bacterium]